LRYACYPGRRFPTGVSFREGFACPDRSRPRPGQSLPLVLGSWGYGGDARLCCCRVEQSARCHLQDGSDARQEATRKAGGIHRKHADSSAQVTRLGERTRGTTHFLRHVASTHSGRGQLLSDIKNGAGTPGWVGSCQVCRWEAAARATRRAGSVFAARRVDLVCRRRSCHEWVDGESVTGLIQKWGLP